MVCVKCISGVYTGSGLWQSEHYPDCMIGQIWQLLLLQYIGQSGRVEGCETNNICCSSKHGNASTYEELQPSMGVIYNIIRSQELNP